MSSPRRFVGESYRDCIDRLIGELTAARKDNERLRAALGRRIAREELLWSGKELSPAELVDEVGT